VASPGVHVDADQELCVCHVGARVPGSDVVVGSLEGEQLSVRVPGPRLTTVVLPVLDATTVKPCDLKMAMAANSIGRLTVDSSICCPLSVVPTPRGRGPVPASRNTVTWRSPTVGAKLMQARLRTRRVNRYPIVGRSAGASPGPATHAPGHHAGDHHQQHRAVGERSSASGRTRARPSATVGRRRAGSEGTLKDRAPLAAPGPPAAADTTGLVSSARARRHAGRSQQSGTDSHGEGSSLPGMPRTACDSPFDSLS